MGIPFLPEEIAPLTTRIRVWGMQFEAIRLI